MKTAESGRDARIPISLALAVSSILTAGQVVAQDSQSAPEQLEEIVVSAQRRSHGKQRFYEKQTVITKL